MTELYPEDSLLKPFHVILIAGTENHHHFVAILVVGYELRLQDRVVEEVCQVTEAVGQSQLRLEKLQRTLYLLILEGEAHRKSQRARC